jgi:5'-nucleotidase
MRKFAAAALLGLAGCALPEAQIAPPPPPMAPLAEVGPLPVDVKIIAFNDFHGNLEPPKQSVEASGVKVPAGGLAYLASAVDSLRAANPYNVVVSAGDMIGASPLVSAAFLDEPTIAGMNLLGVDFNAIGNHEFDRGRAELLRMQNGGCEKNTALEPCRVEPFTGARFEFLAANTLTESGSPLLPAYGVRSFGSGAAEVKVGFIGMTLKDTPTVTSPSGVAGLTFTDEAATANALIPKLRSEGADAIVVLIHQGATVKGGTGGNDCEELSGDLLPILDRLDPAVDLVVSGHTHRSYVCDYGRVNPGRPFLLTSAGSAGTMLTDITLRIDPAAGKVVAKSADNLIVQSEAFRGSAGEVPLIASLPRFQPKPEVEALVGRYASAAADFAGKIVGKLTGPASREKTPSGEHVLGNLIADAQLAATRVRRAGGSQIAFMNPGGVRADVVPGPGGSVTYGQIFAAQPFGNSLVVKSFTGRQIRALLEQQFAGPKGIEAPVILLPSSTFRYSYDLSKPAGQRIVKPILEGKPLRDDTVYRVTMNSFLASGGDNFTVFREGRDQLGGGQDIDALEAYVRSASPLTPPATDRIVNLTPR